MSTPPLTCRLRRRTREALRGERGAVSLELIIATPLLMFVLLVIVQAGLWSHATHLAQAAASRGLAAARVHHGTAQQGHDEAARLLDALGSASLTDIRIDIDRGPDTASAHITGHASSVVPGLKLPVRATTSGPVERLTTTLALPREEAFHDH
ncbi:TadE family protein [Actinoalloteichus caeruleus]|uniref:TadE family protein n=1 Tax=Actinoalloteichus cyanogriseus TaxID=2893586 RepID=UPI003AB00299